MVNIKSQLCSCSILWEEGKNKWRASNINFKCIKQNLHISCLLISQWWKLSTVATPKYKGIWETGSRGAVKTWDRVREGSVSERGNRAALSLVSLSRVLITQENSPSHQIQPLSRKNNSKSQQILNPANRLGALGDSKEGRKDWILGRTITVSNTNLTSSLYPSHT